MSTIIRNTVLFALWASKWYGFKVLLFCSLKAIIGVIVQKFLNQIDKIGWMSVSSRFTAYDAAKVHLLSFWQWGEGLTFWTKSVTFDMGYKLQKLVCFVDKTHIWIILLNMYMFVIEFGRSTIVSLILFNKKCCIFGCYHKYIFLINHRATRTLFDLANILEYFGTFHSLFFGGPRSCFIVLVICLF